MSTASMPSQCWTHMGTDPRRHIGQKGASRACAPWLLASWCCTGNKGQLPSKRGLMSGRNIVDKDCNRASWSRVSTGAKQQWEHLQVWCHRIYLVTQGTNFGLSTKFDVFDLFMLRWATEGHQKGRRTFVSTWVASMAERSKAFDSSSNNFGCVGSNPTWSIILVFSTASKSDLSSFVWGFEMARKIFEGGWRKQSFLWIQQISPLLLFGHTSCWRFNKWHLYARPAMTGPWTHSGSDAGWHPIDRQARLSAWQ